MRQGIKDERTSLHTLTKKPGKVVYYYDRACICIGCTHSLKSRPALRAFKPACGPTRDAHSGPRCLAETPRLYPNTVMAASLFSLVEAFGSWTAAAREVDGDEVVDEGMKRARHAGGGVKSVRVERSGW